MCGDLSDRVTQLREEAEIIEKACPSKVDFSHLRQLLYDFRLPDDETPSKVASADAEDLFDNAEHTVDDLEDDEA